MTLRSLKSRCWSSCGQNKTLTESRDRCLRATSSSAPPILLFVCRATVLSPDCLIFGAYTLTLSGVVHTAPDSSTSRMCPWLPARRPSAERAHMLHAAGRVDRRSSCARTCPSCPSYRPNSTAPGFSCPAASSAAYDMRATEASASAGAATRSPGDEVYLARFAHDDPLSKRTQHRPTMPFTPALRTSPAAMGPARQPTGLRSPARRALTTEFARVCMPARLRPVRHGVAKPVG